MLRLFQSSLRRPQNVICAARQSTFLLARETKGWLSSPTPFCAPNPSGVSLLNLALGGVRGIVHKSGLDEFRDYDITQLRNIGISAHIDSGKTTLTERILFYTGKIREMHEVGGKDGVGAKMDSMDLEREKGITIQSAATYTNWKGTPINVIDTPGHVDFTIEVERSLRVLDGAIMLVCGSSGVQSQTLTVDRQMKRYAVPRVIFINKLDRLGADPFRAIGMIRKELGLTVAPTQIPIGTEAQHLGVVDVIEKKAWGFEGPGGVQVVEIPVPHHLIPQMDSVRKDLIETLANLDEEIGELFLLEQEPTAKQIKAAIRRQTIALKFCPVLMGSAYKNKGVQLLLDAVIDYLPNPTEVQNHALDTKKNEDKVILQSRADAPLVALAFKLEEGRFGQVTYMRVYQGLLKKGDFITNTMTGQRLKVPRLVKMHSNEMSDVQGAAAGEIVAMFGVDCNSGTTFTSGDLLTMSSMHVPEPVISLAISPKSQSSGAQFRKGLSRFQKEDPTFKVTQDEESQETIISGMGELHLEIYAERLNREYGVECKIGHPKVNYRERPTRRIPFNYLHKKQSGGQGQYGRVVGYIEPLDEGDTETFRFENKLVGLNIPPEYHSAIQKGFREACGPKASGVTGHPIVGVRVVLEDGQSHPVDSSELAFKTAALYAFTGAFKEASPEILEPVMKVEVFVPSQFSATVLGGVTKRRGMIMGVESSDNITTTIQAQVPLSQMFGYSSDLRSQTEGKGEYSMEFLEMGVCMKDTQEALEKEWARVKYLKTD